MSTLISYYRAFDDSVKRNLEKAGMKTRPGAGNGLYCGVLIPLIMLIFCIRYPVSSLYLVTSVLSFGLLMSSALVVMFLSISGTILRNGEYAGTLASAITATLICSEVLNTGLAFSVATCVPFTFAYSYGMNNVLNALPYCFTLGEAMLVLQGVVLFMFAAVVNVANPNGRPPATDGDIVTLVVQAGLLTVALIMAQCYFLRGPEHTLSIIGSVGATVSCLLLGLHSLLGRSSVIWLFGFIADRNRLLLISSWAMLVALAVVAVRFQTSIGQKASTSTRKVFHALAVAVYLPGALADVELMTLAAGIAVALLFVAEALRKSNIEPFSTELNEAFEIFADEKDIGGFSLTPIYLLVGVSTPLALVPAHQETSRSLQLLSGVLSIGIGDAAASWLGSCYGKHRWPGSQRTVEGTASNILSQLCVVCVLRYNGFLEDNWVLYRALIASTVAGAVEATTEQIDNLVLPFVVLLTLALC